MTEQAVPASPPRRRFLPEPVETTRSSKRYQQVKPAIEHVENNQEKPKKGDREPEIVVTPDTPADNPPRRRFAPEPVETLARSSRKKFAPEPVETSTRSSKDRKTDEEKDNKPPARRKFAPEPVETSSRSSKDRIKEEQGDDKPAPRRKFLPEPVETSSTSTRRRKKVPDPEEEAEEEESSSPVADLPPSRSSTSTSTGSRKFKPEVLEVARGSYRKDKSSSGQSSPKESQLPSPPTSPESSKAELDEPQESRFSAAALAKRHHQHRQHSFQVPELPIIESDSDQDNTPGLSDISSSESDTDLRRPNFHQTFTDHVEQLAAKAADKELRNQMLAAYINERPHEPVDHFAVSHDEDEEPHGKLSGMNGIDIKTFRRDSVSDYNWELQNLRRHHEQLEKMKEDLKKDTAGQSRFSAAALAARHHGIGVKKVNGGKKEKRKTKDEEMKKMRSAASPPMLGDDLWFPQSLSPKMTRCDVDQVPRPRSNDSDDEDEIEGDPMLWQTSTNISTNSGGGLWGGLCQKIEIQSRPPTPLRSGLQTPAIEGRKHKANYSGSHFLPLTPPREWNGDDPFTASIDRKLNMEREFDAQFPPSVITQVYNYISLGYPVLAHAFDEELSKISRIPVHELRRDDDCVDAKGHVGVPEGCGADEEIVIGGKCKRWEALRLYCKEWWRQSPQMVERGPEDWGSSNRLRRGSWNR